MMIARIYRSPFTTATLLDVAVPPQLLPYWKLVCLFWQSQRQEDAGYTHNRVQLVLDTAENSLSIRSDLFGDAHMLTLLHCPALMKYSAIAPLLGWWIIECQRLGASGGAFDYALLPAELRSLILAAV